MEYMILENIFMRAGISTEPIQYYSFGLGFNQKSIKADIAFTQHNKLGFTPHISFCYVFNKKNNP